MFFVRSKIEWMINREINYIKKKIFKTTLCMSVSLYSEQIILGELQLNL